MKRVVITQARISVLVVRHPTQQLKRLLICTAGQQASATTVDAGARLAQATGARVTLLHVTAAVPSMYAGLTHIAESLPELLQTDTPVARNLRQQASQLEALGIDAQVELRHGVPAREILRTFDLCDFDLLVLGASDTRRRKRLLLDEVSLQVTTHAPRPVLLVRPGLLNNTAD